MARGFYVRVDDNALGNFERDGRDAASDAAFQACEVGAAISRTKAPKLTGALVGSISVGKAKRGAATISVNVPYGVYQEFGTHRGVEGKHYIRQGVSAAQRAWVDIVERNM